MSTVQTVAGYSSTVFTHQAALTLWQGGSRANLAYRESVVLVGVPPKRINNSVDHITFAKVLTTRYPLYCDRLSLIA